MSYEGYEQCICENGHYFENTDIYLFEDLALCNTCSRNGLNDVKAAWINQVDETNKESEGIISLKDLIKHFLIIPEVLEVCSFGFSHIKEPAIFRVPTREETDPLRQY